MLDWRWRLSQAQALRVTRLKIPQAQRSTSTAWLSVNMNEEWETEALSRQCIALSSSFSPSGCVALCTPKKNKRPQEKLVSTPAKPELPGPRVQNTNPKDLEQRFIRLLTPWKKQFPVGHGLPGSWIHAVKTRAGPKLTCKACAFVKSRQGQTPAALKARKYWLRRHSHSAFHKKALDAYRQHMWANDSKAQRLSDESGAPHPRRNSQLCGVN